MLINTVQMSGNWITRINTILEMNGIELDRVISIYSWYSKSENITDITILFREHS